jgi:hypothetical protein
MLRRRGDGACGAGGAHRLTAYGASTMATLRLDWSVLL